jgi:N-acetylneuraminate synthase
MTTTVEMFGRRVGDGQPCLVIAEAGVNHNGSEALALKLIDAAHEAGADVVKFQKRTPHLAVPQARWNLPRESCCAPPGERITELEHRERVELDAGAYEAIAVRSITRGIPWFASPWDVPSVEFLEAQEVPAYKVASASVTDRELLAAVGATRKPVIMSTGMSTLQEIERALAVLTHINPVPVVLLHTCSAYPMENSDANLRAMHTLRITFGYPVGYSGHERGLQVSLAAVAMGACVIERHLTLDRTMRGSDHAASLEPKGFAELVRDIRVIESAMGDGHKVPRQSEMAARERLRKVAA